MFLKDYISDVFKGVKSLAIGMKRTGYYFTHHKEIITMQYPENKATLHLSERFRGEVVMPHDEHNEHRCTGCQACEIGTIDSTRCRSSPVRLVHRFRLVEASQGVAQVVSNTGQSGPGVDNRIESRQLSSLCFKHLAATLGGRAVALMCISAVGR